MNIIKYIKLLILNIPLIRSLLGKKKTEVTDAQRAIALSKLKSNINKAMNTK